MDSGSDDLKEPLLEPREVHKMAIGLVLITLWTSALPPEIPLAAGAIYIGGCYVAVYLNKSGLFVRWVKPLAFWGLCRRWHDHYVSATYPILAARAFECLRPHAAILGLEFIPLRNACNTNWRRSNTSDSWNRAICCLSTRLDS